VVDARGAAIFLPFRSSTDAMSSRTTSASASPITSKIHGTWNSMPVDRPRDTGLDPARPMSIEFAATASITEPPESKIFHSISVSGKASSSQPFCLTIRSPLGIAW